MNELDFLIAEKGKNIRVFYATETVDDPNYQEKTVSYLNSLPVRALVSEIGYTSSQWRMPGIKASSTMELTCNKRYKKLIEKSRKIIIEDVTYYGWKPSNGNKIQIQEVDDYITIMIHTDETK